LSAFPFLKYKEAHFRADFLCAKQGLNVATQQTSKIQTDPNEF